MFWKVFITTFTAIFMAELADKTQLIGISLTAKTGKPIAVFLGSISGYIVVTIGTVFIGAILGKYIKPDVMRYAGASIFLGISVLMFMGKI